jgi:ABC-type uncharacterized transport system permease subunit
MLKLETRPQPSKAMSLLSPLIALALTVLIGSVLFSALGKDPVRALQIFFVEPVKNGYALSELAVKAVPLVLIALGLALCFRSNLWNIGAEGQFILGALAGGWVAMQADAQSSGGIVVLILLAGVLGGMAWAALVALLRDRFNANEILVSLMLVYVAEMLLNYLVYGPVEGPAGLQLPADHHVPGAHPCPAPGGRARRMNIGLCWLALAAVGVLGFLFRTYAGLCAASGRAGAGGGKVRRLFVAQGAVDGAVGVRRHGRPGRGRWRWLGPLGQLTPYVPVGYGFAAIIVAFVGRLAPGGHRLLGGADEHVLHRR